MARSSERGKRWWLAGLVATLASLLFVGSAAATVHANVFAGGYLSVFSDGADPIAITCVGGNVKVNGADPNLPTACSAITIMEVTGGSGANAIDLSGVTQAAFPGIGTGAFAVEDAIYVSGNLGDDSLTGGEYPENLVGGPGADTIDGAGGSDELTFVGTAGADMIDATDGAGTLTAGTDTDAYISVERFLLLGGPGNDTLSGGSLDDMLEGGDGTNTLNGEGGADRVFFTGTQNRDVLVGTPPNGTLTAGLATDNYSSIETFSLVGSGGDDDLTGGAGNDSLFGGSGNDKLIGGGGNDLLSGETPTDFLPSDDQLDGGAGADTLLPGYGTDSVLGGAGDDVISTDLEGVENDSWDGQEGSDLYWISEIYSNPTPHTLTLADSGPVAGALDIEDDPPNTDTLRIDVCTDVAVTTTQASKENQVIAFSGVEKLPCGGPPQPQPPPPPPQPPPPSPPPPSPPPPAPPPAPPPPAPKPKAKPVAKKVTLCHRGHTIKVKKSLVRKHRKHGDKLGPCRRTKKPKKR